MSDFVSDLANKFIESLNQDEMNCLAQKLNQQSLVLDVNNNNKMSSNKTTLPEVLDELEISGKIGQGNYSPLIDALIELGHMELVQSLMQEELSYKFSRLEFTEIKHSSLLETKRSSDQEDRPPTRPPGFAFELDGLKIELMFEPYKFQRTLARLGCQGINNIVCCRTGSGKTLVAAIICKYWTTKRGAGNFHAAFIVPTRHLAAQQMNAFHMAGFEIDDLEEIKESMNDVKTANCLKQRQVVFLTAQKLVNALSNGRIQVRDLDMLIFDECHHTTLKHPYTDIMNFYHAEKKNSFSSQGRSLPVIVGLTASLGVGQSNDAVKQLLSLCNNLDCERIASLTQPEDLTDLEKNIPSTLQDCVIQVDMDAPGLVQFLEFLSSTSRQVATRLRLPFRVEMGFQEYEGRLVEFKTTFEKNDSVMELVAVKHLIDLNLEYLKAKDLPLEGCLEFLDQCKQKTPPEKQPSQIEAICRRNLDILAGMLQKNLENPTFANPKLKKLVEIILKCHEKGSKGLVLMRTRQGVIALENYLNKHSELQRKAIRAIKLLGQNNSDALVMNEREQKKAIDEFREGKANLLVATDIAQEGLDVPECNYVIRYEFVSNEIGTVQSRGRARADAGQLYLITERNSLNYRREMENRKREEDMNQALAEFNSFDADSFKKLLARYKPDRNFQLAHSVSLNSFLFKPELASSLRTSSSSKSLSNANDYKVHCRHCTAHLFPAVDIRYREPSYFCINAKFIAETIRVESSGLFFCQCGCELGRQVPLRRGNPLHMIDIKGIKFAKKNFPSYLTHSKWSQVEFHIQTLN